MRTFDGVAELARSLGHIGESPWRRLTQSEVTAFAEATGDRQWIHVDPDRAATGPFGRAIGHGYYLLALLPVLMAEVFAIDGVGAVVNTGVDHLRFHRPVPVGARLRISVALTEAELRRRGVAEVAFEVGLEVEDVADPAMTATIRQMVRPPMMRP
ncbi:MaoC family dehydratase [Actinokineospora xionganensis]|uniref:MaoC family dehydratase n=1 Tax=Actinokineospora xionganensis TaxID=2684470 RepID=A0ABR7L5E3_9PSEU|nr:MaoC family dehydratase [Actinokineospora xionganensis]MBC6447899.1 MaoC family dehydratase [Actinokineospora xionganensis]